MEWSVDRSWAECGSDDEAKGQWKSKYKNTSDSTARAKRIRGMDLGVHLYVSKKMGRDNGELAAR